MSRLDNSRQHEGNVTFTFQCNPENPIGPNSSLICILATLISLFRLFHCILVPPGLFFAGTIL